MGGVKGLNPSRLPDEFAPRSLLEDPKERELLLGGVKLRLLFAALDLSAFEPVKLRLPELSSSPPRAVDPALGFPLEAENPLRDPNPAVLARAPA